MRRACLLLAVTAVVAGDAGDCAECNTGDCSRCRRCVNTKSGPCEACWADKKLGACLMVDRSLGDCRQCWDRGSRGAAGAGAGAVGAGHGFGGEYGKVLRAYSGDLSMKLQGGYSAFQQQLAAHVAAMKALQEKPEVKHKLRSTFGEHWRVAVKIITGLLAALVGCCFLIFCRRLCVTLCCCGSAQPADEGYAKVALALDGDVEMTGPEIVSAADGVGSAEFFGLDDMEDEFGDLDDFDMEGGAEGGASDVDGDLDFEDLDLEHV